MTSNGPPVTIQCEQCGKDHTVSYEKRRVTRFCSVSCASKFNKNLGSNGVRGIQTLKWDSDEYITAHKKVRKERDRAYKCSVCHKQRSTQWAYLDGDPQNVNNYVEMCIKCHWRFDHRRVAVIK